MKRLLLAAILVLALGLAACARDSDPTPDPGTTAEAPAPGEATPAPQDEDTPREHRTVTLTLSNAGFADHHIWPEMNCWQYIYNNLGITLDVRMANEEQLGIMFAGGDLTDIVSPRQRFIPAVITGNLAMDLYPLIDSHLPNLRLPTFAASVELSRLFMGGPDNQLFFLATAIGPNNANIVDMTTRGYIVRWDLYEELGMPPINSDADFIQILYDMVQLFPETPDGRPVYAFGLNSTFQPWHERAGFIREGSTGNFWTFNGFLYAASYYDTSVLINGYTDPNSFHWLDMRFYNSLWNLGLLDPDSFTMTSGEAAERMRAQQYVSQVNRNNELYNVMIQEDPYTLAGMVVIPSTNAFFNGNRLSPAGGMPTDSHFVFSGSDNWEAALEVLNTFRDPEFMMMMWNGIRGDTWDYDENGRPFLTERGIAARLAAPLGSEANRRDTGILGPIWDWTPVATTAIHPTSGSFFSIAEEFEYRALLLNPLYRHVAEVWGVETTSMEYQRWVDEGLARCWRYDYAQVVAMGITDIPTDILRIMNNVNEITIRFIPRLVMAATDEEFYALQQEYWDEIAAAGEATAWEWAYNAYREAWEMASPIFWEARRATDELLEIRRNR